MTNIDRISIYPFRRKTFNYERIDYEIIENEFPDVFMTHSRLTCDCDKISHSINILSLFREVFMI